MKQLEQYYEQLNNQLMEFHFSSEIEVHEVENNPPLSSNELKKFNESIGVDSDNQSIYSLFNGCSFNWTHTNNLQGSVNIQSSSNFLENQWTDMVTHVENANHKINKFRVFDFYSNQNYVGLFLDDPKKDVFYIRELDGYSLKLNINSYFILSVLTMGLMHWPSLIIKWEYDLNLNESKNIEEQLISTIPNFNLKHFKFLYDQLKNK